MPRKKDQRPSLKNDEILMTTVYWRHKNTKYDDYRRITTTIKDSSGQEADLGLVEFYFLHQSHSVSPQKRKRTGKPFHPTSASTRRRISEAASGKQGPSSIFMDITNKSGGAINCESVSDLPRNIKQVKNARTRIKAKQKEQEFIALLDLTQNNSCIKNLQWTPVPRVVFSYDQVLEEIVKNCCQVDSSSILSIDTTYGIGDKFVTSTSYQNTMLIDVSNDKYANLPGPAMFHVSEKKEDFVYFSHTLVQQNEKFECTRFVGSDRGSSLRGFLQPLKGAVNLPCTKHVKDNCEAQMVSLGMNNDSKKTIISDIFGCQLACKKGLIDSDSIADFDLKLEVLGKKWCGLDKGNDFLHYFKVNISNDMKMGMLPPVRKAIGLGDGFFYNNAIECAHFKYKNKLREFTALTSTGNKTSIKVSWLDALKIYKSMVDDVRENIRLAVVGKGPYRLSSKANRLAMSPVEWSKMTPEARRKHLAKLDPFCKTAVSNSL